MRSKEGEGKIVSTVNEAWPPNRLCIYGIPLKDKPACICISELLQPSPTPEINSSPIGPRLLKVPCLQLILPQKKTQQKYTDMQKQLGEVHGSDNISIKLVGMCELTCMAPSTKFSARTFTWVFLFNVHNF